MLLDRNEVAEGLASIETCGDSLDGPHTVEELVDLLRVDSPDPRVTNEVRRKLADQISWMLEPKHEQIRGFIFANYNRTPEEIAEARRRMSLKSRPARPLPPGMTLEDVTVGKWPGDETDEQVREAMEHVE